PFSLHRQDGATGARTARAILLVSAPSVYTWGDHLVARVVLASGSFEVLLRMPAARDACLRAGVRWGKGATRPPSPTVQAARHWSLAHRIGSYPEDRASVSGSRDVDRLDAALRRGEQCARARHRTDRNSLRTSAHHLRG